MYSHFIVAALRVVFTKKIVKNCRQGSDDGERMAAAARRRREDGGEVVRWLDRDEGVFGFGFRVGDREPR